MGVIGLRLPNFRRSVKWGPGLGLQKFSFVKWLAHIEVPQLRLTLLVQKDVGNFNISVTNASSMNGFEGQCCLDENFPDLRLFEEVGLAFDFFDFLTEVPIVSILLNEAKCACSIEKCLTVGRNIGTTYTRHHNCLVDSVELFVLLPILHIDLFHGVNFRVLAPTDLENSCEASLP